MSEVRVQAEGTLRFVQASASALPGWTTGTAPASGLFGYVDSFSFTSARTLATQSDRGVPNHHKEASRQPITVTVNFRWTGAIPQPATAAGASMPEMHLEFRASEPENAGSGRYYQFYRVPYQQVQFNEGAEGDTIAATFMALGMSGANPSGYLG